MEKWMAIPGYEGLYEVSDKGNFRSLDRVVTKRNGTRVRYKGREVALDYGKRNGYPVVHLCKNGKAATLNAHRIVAECFLGRVDGKPYVNHKDGNKKNCAASNLEWVTASENAIHAYKVLGRKHPRLGTCGTKFSPEEVRSIRRDERPVRDIAKEYETSPENIYNIKRRKTYAIIED